MVEEAKSELSGGSVKSLSASAGGGGAAALGAALAAGAVVASSSAASAEGYDPEDPKVPGVHIFIFCHVISKIFPILYGYIFTHGFWVFMAGSHYEVLSYIMG